MNPIIRLSDNAANRIKEIMSDKESNSIGVRVAVKSGGCAGMSYVMEYAREINPTDEIIEDKGVKVFVDAAAVMYLLGTEMDYKKEEFSSSLSLITQMSLIVVVVESLLKFDINYTHICIANNTYLV
jgi:iron-sulfur cluster assembly protein